MKSRNLSRLAGLALLVACGVMMARPALIWAKSNAFMKIAGVPGESTDDKHKDWIEILSFSYGAAQTSSASGGAGTGAAIHDLVITKNIDRASPKLAECLTKGNNFGDVTLETWRADGKPGYTTFIMKNVRIVSIKPNPDGKTEKLQLAYQSLQKSQL
jgi:type VI secretion system secreted protein Hcp